MRVKAHLNAIMGERWPLYPQSANHPSSYQGHFNRKGLQVIFSDTPGIIEPRYKLHEKMMQAVKSSLEDADGHCSSPM